jgi:hypothetical protein
MLWIRFKMLLLLRIDNMQKNIEQNVGQERDSDLPEWLEVVRRQVSSLKFGTVQITVHDSRITQVERVEKVRLDRPNPGPAR